MAPHPLAPPCSERNDGLYRVITYLVAKMVEELGIALLNSLVFCECCLWCRAVGLSCLGTAPRHL